MKRLSLSTLYRDMVEVLKDYSIPLLQLAGVALIARFFLGAYYGSESLDFIKIFIQSGLQDGLGYSFYISAIIGAFFYFTQMLAIVELVFNKKIDWKKFYNPPNYFIYMHHMGILIILFLPLRLLNILSVLIGNKQGWFADSSLDARFISCIALYLVLFLFIYFLSRLFLSPYALVSGRAKNCFEALSVSWKITEGNFLKIAALSLIAFVFCQLIAFFLALFAAIIFYGADLSGVLAISSVLGYLTVYIVAACLYKQLVETARENKLLE